LEETVCDILIVGGGGGGGMDMGGGGGAGGFIKLNNQVLNGTYTIKVGNGGNGAPAAGTNGQPSNHEYTINAKNGSDSQFGDNIAIGGGYGGTGPYTHQLKGQANSGGSGGGSSGYQANNDINKAGKGTVGQGNRGGFGLNYYHSGGGGGAGKNGGGAPSNAAGAAKGGDGIYSDITGIGYYWAGGGGGSGYSTTGGNGGLGGGGGGAINTTAGGSGYNNGEPGGGGGTDRWANTPGGNAGQHTGGGGGGGSHYNSNNKGGNGGSGIVIIKYYNKKGDPDYELTKFNKYTKKSHIINDIKNFEKKENFTINIPNNNKEPYNNYLSSFIFLQNANYKFRFDIEKNNRNIYNIREIRLYNNNNLNNNNYLVVALDNKTTNKWVKIAISGIYRIELIVISINTGQKSDIKFSIKAVNNTDDEKDLLTFTSKDEIKYEDNMINVFKDITNLMFIDDKLLLNDEYIKINNIFNRFLFENNSDNFGKIIQYFKGKYGLPNDDIRIAKQILFDSNMKTYNNRLENDLSGNTSIQKIDYMYKWINEIVIENKLDNKIKHSIKQNTNIRNIFNISDEILIQYITFEQTKDSKDYGKERSIYVSIF